MKEYFEEQLKNAEPLTEEKIEALRQNRIENGLSTDSLEDVVPGDIFLFVMVNYDKGTNEDGSRKLECNIEKILEREIDDFCDAHNFIGMVGTNNNLPRFEPKCLAE